MHTKIRKCGSSPGIIIPSPVLSEAGFRVGDAVNIEVFESKIVVEQIACRYTLDALLEESPQEAMALDEEDREWLHNAPVGAETGTGIRS